MDFDFNANFNSGLGIDYNAYLNLTPALGSGFTPVTNANYNDAWIETDLHRYVGTPVTVEIHGVGPATSSPGAGSNAPTTSTPPATASQSIYSITDLNGGLLSAGKVGLEMLTDRAIASSGAIVQQVPHAVSTLEAQAIKTVTGLPNLVGGVVSLGQVAQSYIQHDARGVWTNSANFFGGMGGAELGVFVAAALGVSTATTLGAVVVVAAGGGILMSWGAGALYDMATGQGMSEERLSGMLNSARQGVRSFYMLNPNAPGANLNLFSESD